MNVEAVKDLVGDNPGPLAELWNLDKGCWVVPLGRDTPDNDRVYPELVEGLRFRVRHWREIRRNQNNRILEALKGFEGRSVLRNRHYFKVIVLKGFIFSYFFS